jgi:hypothetical protein
LLGTGRDGRIARGSAPARPRLPDINFRTFVDCIPNLNLLLLFCVVVMLQSLP